MRKLFVEIRRNEKQAEHAARKITTALDYVDPDVKVAALSSVGELRLQLRDLQRQNLCLQFLVDAPGFDLERALEKEKKYIENFFSEGQPFSSLNNRYDYEFFSDNFHPDYVVGLCKYLSEVYETRNLPQNDLWLMLLKSSGYITQNITDNFGPIETDDGVY